MKKIAAIASITLLFIGTFLCMGVPAVEAVTKTANPVKKAVAKPVDLIIAPIKLSLPKNEGARKNQTFLYGYVRDNDGKPMSGAFVNIYYLNFKPGMEVTGYANASTDSDGRYEFNMNPDFYPFLSGQYTIAVSGPNSLGLSLSNYSAFVRDDEQMKIDIAKTQRLDIILFNRSTQSKPMPDTILYGKVLDKDTGKPVSDAEIAIYFKGRMGSFISTTNQDGFYQFNATNNGYDGGYTLNRLLSQAPPEFSSKSKPEVDFFEITVFGANKRVTGTLTQYPEKWMAGKREINFQVSQKVK